MKIPTLIALGALCLTANVTNAQTANDKNGGVQLKDIPDIGQLFRAPTTPDRSAESSLFGPDMPPSPKMPPAPTRDAKNARLKLSVLKSSKGDIFQIEVANQSRAAILKKITDVMGVRAVIDPQLEKKVVITQVFRGLSWDDLLRSVNYGIEMVKSPSGTYFFADKPFGLASAEPFNYDLRTRDFADREKKRADSTQGLYVLPRDSTQGLYIFPRIDIYPKGRFGEPIKPQPQPHWEKREFNGREFYYIPMPKPTK